LGAHENGEQDSPKLEVRESRKEPPTNGVEQEHCADDRENEAHAENLAASFRLSAACCAGDPVLRNCSNRITLGNMKTLTVKLPDPLFLEIAHQARARNISKSDVVRERLTTGKDGGVPRRKRPLWSRMHDVVIDSDRLPRDLSSSKKHLTGYGKNNSHR
jgi:hypothetical protein